MIITNKDELTGYVATKRIWQGIPGIERTEKGRLFATWYSGGVSEQYGNYVVLVKSDDNGCTWSEPIAVAYNGEESRCYDPCLWIDPLKRLWLIWAVMPQYGVYASICDDPDADTLKFSEPRKIGRDVMMNKPTVLNDGSWVFPMAVWQNNVVVVKGVESAGEDRGAYLCRTVDNGQSFTRLGCPTVDNPSFDEHMALEKLDGTLQNWMRTRDGICIASSNDGGATYEKALKFPITTPDSRFHICRLKSGKLLLIAHKDTTKRNNLCALLSDDDGISWKYSLMLDERSSVSYPDVKQGSDGYIYVVYDRERGGYKKSYAESKDSAKEILIARITEDDIIAGQIEDPNSKLRMIVSKLDHFDGNPDQMYAKYVK